MKKVKLIIVNSQYDSYETLTASMVGAISDWEEISDEDYTYLKTNWWQFKQNLELGYSADVVLIEEDAIQLHKRIDNLKEYIDNKRKEMEAKQKAQKELLEKKQKEKAIKLKEKKQKTEQEELALLQALKEKYKEKI